MPAHSPSLLIGVILVAYWARVLRMARKARRSTGRAANLVPPEPLGRALRLVWYPVVGLWIVLPFVHAFQKHPRGMMSPAYIRPAIEWAAALVAALTFTATIVCWKRMGKSWRMGINPDETTALVVTGPYAYVRHPIYALSSLLMLATLAAVPTPLMAAVAAAHVILLQWEARREERYLVSRHARRYEAYRNRVGRFIPRSFRPYTGSHEIQGADS